MALQRSLAIAITVLLALAMFLGIWRLAPPRSTPPGAQCGNGHLNDGEECDAGDRNGRPCTPNTGASCVYCSADCLITRVNG